MTMSKARLAREEKRGESGVGQEETKNSKTKWVSEWVWGCLRLCNKCCTKQAEWSQNALQAAS